MTPDPEKEKQFEMFPTEEIIKGALVPASVAEKLEADERKLGKYTAVRLKKLYPWKYNAIVALLGALVPMRQIADTIGVNFALVAAVSNLEPEVIAKAQEKFAAITHTNSIIAAEALQEMLTNIKGTELKNPTVDQIYKLALASGSMSEKATAAKSGVPTGSTVNIVNVAFTGSWEEFRDQHLKKNTKAIDVTPEKTTDADPTV